MSEEMLQENQEQNLEQDSDIQEQDNAQEPASQTPEEDVQEDAPENNQEAEEGELPAEAKKQVGKAIAQERKKLQRRFQQELQQIEQRYQQQVQQGAYTQYQQPPEGQIYDAVTGEYVDVDSVQGQLALREQKAQQRKQHDQQQQKHREKQSRLQSLAERLQDGFETYEEEGYTEALQTFQQNATEDMADALVALDNPAAVVNYLRDKKGEFQRIARLDLPRQIRAMVEIEGRISPKKKLITNAPEPISHAKESRNVAASPFNQTLDQRSSYWNERINNRG